MKLPLILASLLLAVSSASASVTLQFNSATVSLQNFGNGIGVGGTALVWGIIVDTAGNGFSYALPDTHYDPTGLTYTGGVVQTLNLLVNNLPAGASDDRLFLAPTLMNVQSSTVDGMPAGTNRVTSVAAVPYGGSNGIDAGDAFAVVWFLRTSVPDGSAFPGLNTKFGALNNPGFAIPADGSTTSFASLFTGPDPLKSMDYVMGVPEPASALLGLLGIFGLLRRRR